MRNGVLLSAAGVVIVLVTAILTRNIDPYATFEAQPSLPPGASHIFGTDALGRDVFARLVAGAVPTLTGSVLALVVTLLGATVMGSIAAFAPAALVRHGMDLCIDSLLSMPSILLAMVVLTAINRSPFSAAAAAGLGTMPLAAVVFRDQIRLTVGLPHVTAARSLGAHPLRILWQHILRVSQPALLAYAVTAFASNLLLMTSLSFLGFNGDIASPEWGSMIADARATLRSAPWAVAAPATAIVLTTGALSVAARWISRR